MLTNIFKYPLETKIVEESWNNNSIRVKIIEKEYKNLIQRPGPYC